MNKFEKVSFEQYRAAVGGDVELRAEYDDIKLPVRKTKHSCGYDFHTPFGFDLAPNESIKIPTGVKASIKEGQFLAMFVRSSIGFKYGVVLSNGTGIIDGDYYGNVDNEGHIFIKLVNLSTDGKTLHCEKGDAIAQGIFMDYDVTVDDEADGERVGGIGSTGR